MDGIDDFEDGPASAAVKTVRVVLWTAALRRFGIEDSMSAPMTD